MENINTLKEATILVDTNFFLDLFEHEDKYKDLFVSLSKNDNSLISCDLVKCEFIRTKDKQKLQNKNLLFDKTVSAELHIDKITANNIAPLIEEYGADIEGVSTVDIFLGCYVRRYQSMYLLTRNHKDFPTRIFRRSNIFSIEHDRDVKTYALYQYQPKLSKLEVVDDIPF